MCPLKVAALSVVLLVAVTETTTLLIVSVNVPLAPT
jgi:hypothetical protein